MFLLSGFGNKVLMGATVIWTEDDDFGLAFEGKVSGCGLGLVIDEVSVVNPLLGQGIILPGLLERKKKREWHERPDV